MSPNAQSDRVSARRLLAVLSIVTTLAGGWIFLRMLSSDGQDLLDIVLLALFVILFLWIANSFWLSVMGFTQCLLRPGRSAAPFVPQPADKEAYASLPRSAVIVPVYNEDAREVFSRIRAMMESLHETGRSACFDFFVLSDSNDPEVWLEEELVWADLSADAPGECGLFYRRRENNEGAKSGNIADFCRRWGRSYPYMIVLDADSLMSGWTMLELVRRMEADPQIGILQVPPIPVDRGSLFARLQQFAASVYGVIFNTGFALWTQVDGNYYGHNAALRVRPFMEHCGLPRLPGKPPLGGPILSHDFVEAAFMRRSGYEVIVANDLSGSYEECPPTLIDFAKRDQRWCQGNMQHLRLLMAHGLHPVSRLHLGMGAMSYLSSPLWLLFMLLGALGVWTAHTQATQGQAAAAAGGEPRMILLVAMLVLLFSPKLLGYVLLLSRRDWLALHGGPVRALVSVLIESFSSMLTAPILMAFHASFVVSALAGRSVRWGPQQRDEAGTPLADAVRAHWAHALGGAAALVLVALAAPPLVPWSLPVVTGLILSIPISMLMGSPRVGRFLLRLGLLLIPEEARPPRLLKRQRELSQEAHSRPSRLDRFSQVVLDPVLNELHLAILRAGEVGAAPCERADRSRLDHLRELAVRRGPGHLRRDDKLALLSDEDALRALHLQAWAHWPREVLEAVARAVEER